MKNLLPYKLFFLFIILLCGGMANAQNPLVVGTDRDSKYNSVSPINYTYNHSYTQTIYLESELTSMVGKRITRIGYELTKLPSKSNLYLENDYMEIYMGTTPKSMFSSTTDWVAIGDLKKYYEGGHTVIPDATPYWIEIELDEPYVYTGGNIIIALNTPQKRGNWESIPFYGSSVAEQRVLVARDDNNPININSPGSGNYNSSSEKIVPNTRFYFSDLPEGPEITLSVNSINFGDMEAGGTPMTKKLNVKNTGTEELHITGIDGLTDPFSMIFPVNILPLEDKDIEFKFSATSEGDFLQENIKFISDATNTSSLTFSVKGKAYPTGTLYESFENDEFPPNYWRTRTNSWTKTSDTPYDGLYATHLGRVADTLISPRVSGILTLYAKRSSSVGRIKVLYSTDLINWKGIIPESMVMEDYIRFLADIPSSSFVAITGTDLYVDLIEAAHATYPTKDLLVTSWMVPSELSENTDAEIPVTVKNWGKSVENTYKVYIKDGATQDILLTLDGEAINPLEEKTFVFTWNPQPSVKSIYAEVELTGDVDLTNNKSSVENIDIVADVGVLKATPDGIDFGLLKTYTDTKTVSVTIENTGIRQLVSSSKELSAPFSTDLRDMFSLDEGETDIFNITFGPSEFGIFEDTLKIYHDGLDGITKIPVTGEILRKGDLYEEFDTEEFPPFMWTCKSCDEGKTTWSHHRTAGYGSTGAAYLNSSSASDTLITPKLDIKAGEKLTFYARHWTSDTNEKLFLSIATSPDLKNWTTIFTTSQSNPETELLSTYKPYSVDLTQTGELYIGIVAQTEVLIDVVRGPQIIYPDHDLAIKGITGPAQGAVNRESVYTVTVKNQGTMNETAYTVKLMDGEKVLASVQGEVLPTLEQIELQIPWTPRNTGNYSLIAVVESEDDSNLDNNSSIIITTKVDPENAQVIQIGGIDVYGDVGTSVSTNIPLAARWDYSVCETIYFTDELNIIPGTNVTGVGYKYHYTSEVTIPIRIWIAETEMSTLAESIVQASDMILVYDGDFTFASGGTLDKPLEAWFEFQQPLVSTGKNIVLMIEADYVTPTSRLPLINFYENTSQKSKRTIIKKRDNIALDPVAGLELEEKDHTNQGLFPTTLFKCEMPGLKITGIVNGEGDVPLEEAKITLVSDNILYETTTNEDGTFEMEIYAWNKEYDLTIEKEDHDAYTQKVTVTNEDIDLGTINMIVPSDFCDFTIVVTAATGESLAGTPVKLQNTYTGMVYNENLPESGILFFEQILKGTYSLVIEKDRLVPYNNDDLEIQSNTMRLEIELLENIIVPYGIIADIDYSEETGKGIVDMSWNNDLTAFFDDFENYEDFSISFTPWTGIDVDKASPVPMDITYPNHTEPQYAIIFNPANTTPSRWGYPEMMPFSGYKCVVFTRVQNVPNNDWLIAPKRLIKEGDVISFMAKALGVNETEENFRVAVATKDNPSTNDFTIISEGNSESVGGTWTKFQYDLSSFVGQEIHIAINYISLYKQMLMVDDFYIGRDTPKRIIHSKRVAVNQEEEIYPEYVIYLGAEEKGRTKNMYYTLTDIAAGNYRLGVKAIYRTDETEIVYTDINIDDETHFVSVTANVTTNNNKPAESANVLLSSEAENVMYNKTVVNGKIEIPFARKGEYDIVVNKEGYEVYSESVSLTEDKLLDIQLKEIVGDPYNLSVDLEQNEGEITFKGTFKWNQELGWSDGFEDYEDFTQDIAPWETHNLDVVGDDWPYIWQIDNFYVTFPGSLWWEGIEKSPLAHTAPIVLNPSATTPPVDQYLAAAALEKSKYLLFRSQQLKQSNDWLISPKQTIKEGYVLRFIMKAYGVANLPEGDEVVRICISDTDNKIASFVEVGKIYPGTQNWEMHEIDLAEDYLDKEIFIAFNYASFDQFMVQLDNVYVGPSTSNIPIGEPLEYEVYLGGVSQGKVTDNSYTFPSLAAETTYTAGVKAIYASGSTGIVDIEFTTPKAWVSIDRLTKEILKVYPTIISEGTFVIESDCPVIDVELFNINGQLVKKVSTNKQKIVDVNVHDLAAGIYYVNITTENIRKAVKIIITD